MALSGDTVRAALSAVGAVGKQIKGFDELAAGADGALRSAPAGLTPAGAAAFLATCAVESAWFRTTTEYGSGQRYAPYVGRTFTQLTWSENYAGFGKWCKAKGLVPDANCFVNNPASLSDFRWAWLGAVYYFEAHGIWKWANAGNFRAVSQAVNGGNGRVGTSFTPNGWKERQAMYAVFRAVGAALLPSGTSTAPAASRTPVLTRHRPGEDNELFIQTPDPSAGQAKNQWPARQFAYGFDPPGGWGGKAVLRVNFGPRGGWLHLARWWIRLPDWTPNNRNRMKFWDHPIGAKGTDFAIAADWQTAPPVGASSIELNLSAPDGVHIFMVTEK